jgi:hypothetical protein
MGVFGFLSKAHLEQSASTLDNTAKIERLNQQIVREQSIIDDNTKVIDQLDTAITSYIGKDKTDKALSVRKIQSPQRKQLRDIIDASQKKIDDFSDQKLTLTSEIRNVQLEVGPIKYIADLFTSGNLDDSTKIEYAVKLFTLLIVSTLDPLAVILLIAANKSLIKVQNGKKDKTSMDVQEPYHTDIREVDVDARPETTNQEITPDLERPVDIDPSISNLIDPTTQSEVFGKIYETYSNTVRDVNEEKRLLQKKTTPGQSIWSQIPDRVNTENGSQDGNHSEDIVVDTNNGQTSRATASESDKKKMPVIKEPAITRLETSDQGNAIPWAHQSSILREILGTPSHFVPQSIDSNIIQTGSAGIDDTKYPKSLSWLKEFKGE